MKELTTKTNIMKNVSIVPSMEKPTKLYSRSRSSHTHKNVTSVENKETHAYKWTIETVLGTFTGTCLTINDLNEEIRMLTNNSKILKKNIIPVNEKVEDRIYTWLVTTNSGQISGVSVSLEDAKKVINSFGYNEVLNSEIVESPIHH